MTTFYKKINFLLAFCFCLVLTRVLYTQNLKLSFLLWNLFLAWIPFFASLKLYKIPSSEKIRFFAILGLTILFLPNAIYLVTDLIHLKHRIGVPYWYDVIVLFSFSVLGLIYSTSTLINLEHNLEKIIQKKWVIPSLIGLIFISGYGVYMGRILRWNSWDVFIHPFHLVISCSETILQPMTYPAAYGFTVAYGMIQLLFWYVFRETKI